MCLKFTTKLSLLAKKKIVEKHFFVGQNKSFPYSSLGWYLKGFCYQRSLLVLKSKGEYQFKTDSNWHDSLSCMKWDLFAWEKKNEKFWKSVFLSMYLSNLFLESI